VFATKGAHDILVGHMWGHMDSNIRV